MRDSIPRTPDNGFSTSRHASYAPVLRYGADVSVVAFNSLLKDEGANDTDERGMMPKEWLQSATNGEGNDRGIGGRC